MKNIKLNGTEPERDSVQGCSALPDYEQAIAYLYQRINYERSGHAPYSADHYRLDRIRSLLRHLGDPHLAAPVIHIAGTKGKGSTAQWISAMLQGCGYRTGLYTSPHLLRLEERMRVDGRICSPERLVHLAAQAHRAAELAEAEGAGRATFFELTTAMGFLHFAESQCDAVVLEVGLGGRLDSTNVCSPTLCVLTTIGLDHQAQLGNTIEEITWEKAGIMKPGVPAITSARDSKAQAVFAARAAEVGCELRMIGRDFDVHWQPSIPQLSMPDESNTGQSTNGPHAAVARFQPNYAGSSLGIDWPISMLGRHQADNLAGALAAIDKLTELGWKLPVKNMQRAAAELSLTARLQIVSRRPLCILDTAHNPDSISAALAALDDHFPDLNRTIVFASSRDKDTEAMLQLLIPRCRRLICTQYQNNPRGLPLADLISMAERIRATPGTSNCVLTSVPNPLEAWNSGLASLTANELLCATGSFFLAAELLSGFAAMHST
ncbi:MAG: folylpolyglutamate synthase/dihydrofolate synthase family protein [Pirellulales bacterium]